MINKAHDRFHDEHAGFFGLFECLAHAEGAAIALLGAAESWVRERGATFLRGPVNLSTNQLDCGLLVDGFGTPPVFGSSYNRPYYASFIEGSGFAKCKDLLGFYRYYHPPPTPRILRASKRLKGRSTPIIRPINMRDFSAEVACIVEVYNDAWSDNWGFVPITDAEAWHMAKELKAVVIPELTLLAEIDGQPVGSFVAIPDLNQALRLMNGHVTPWGLLRFSFHRRRIDTVRVVLLGVKKPYRRLGIVPMLLTEMWNQVPKRGIHWELAWVLEDNYLVIRILEEIGAVAYKRYRLYQKECLPNIQPSAT